MDSFNVLCNSSSVNVFTEVSTFVGFVIQLHMVILDFEKNRIAYSTILSKFGEMWQDANTYINVERKLGNHVDGYAEQIRRSVCAWIKLFFGKRKWNIALTPFPKFIACNPPVSHITADAHSPMILVCTLEWSHGDHCSVCLVTSKNDQRPSLEDLHCETFSASLIFDVQTPFGF